MLKRIRTALSLDGVSQSNAGTCAFAVIDVLRASTTIITALANGAREVIPVADRDAALSLAARSSRDQMLLGGERDGLKIDGFDLGNSPGAYTARLVAGKTIIFSTTNGTRALLALGDATREPIAVAAFVNVTAVARWLDRRAVDAAVLVCAGQDGGFSVEDFLCAGAIAARLGAGREIVERDDATTAAALLFHASTGDVATVVSSGEHARALTHVGLGVDIDACCRLDQFDIVPALRTGVITA